MKCPECQTENPDTQKFCGECGAKLEKVCPGCGIKNPPQYKFCGECGHNLLLASKPSLKDPSFDEKIQKIQKYLPKGLTEKILSQRNRIEGERRLVTVMFCDMEGYTELSERLGPEEAYDTMDQVYEILIHMVHNYEGTVNEMTGDGIMALFGAPIALEDAPQRAIRSALAIHREMAKFSDRIKEKKEGIPPLRMRVGIHTGPVVVGTLGNDLRVEFKAVGETVNLASRMEGLAEPGATLVTEDTFKLTEGFFRLEALGEKKVKGKKEPIRVYRVIAPSTRRTRFEISAERGLTPFVGRERELDLLLDAFERTKAGRGQAVSIMSEAGLGKSRLLYEFRKAVANVDATFLEGKCLSYSRGVAYHPIIDIIKSNFDILEGDKESEIRKKLENGLKTVGADEASTLPYLLELLSIKDSRIDKIPMTPEARKDRIIEALKQIVLKGSEVRPVIMAYEDLHWVDRSSEDVLKYILEGIPGARVLMIFTYRPEFVHTWGAKSFHNQITLNRLSNRESVIMMSHLLGTENIDRDLEELVLEKTEGVPFFIEEFIKSIKDLRIIEKKDNKYHLAKDIRDLAIPSTIQDVIMARVDSLPEGAKDVLQTGSVIEREFSYELIKRVTGLPDQELLSHLSVLRDSELLYDRGIFPQSTCIFKHTLTREVVYDSILTVRKKRLHEIIGNAAEELHKDSIEEHYEVLSGHFIYSENYEKGAEYSKLAGKKAEKSASLNDAISYVQKRIACLEKLPVTEDVQEKMIDARTALGLYISQLNHPVEAKEAIDPIIGVAIRSHYKRRLSQIYTIIGVYNLYVEEDIPKALKHLEEAIRISDEANDILSSVLARHWLGVALSLNCEFEKASDYIEKALDITTVAKNLWGISTMKATQSYWVYNLQGRFDLAYQTSEEAMRIAEESGGTYLKATAYLAHGTSCLHKGLFEEAKEHLSKGVDFCERINLFIYHRLDHNQLAEAYFDAGEYQKSKDHYSKAIRLLEHARFSSSFINLNKISRARAKVMNSERDIDLEALSGYVAENKLKVNDGQMRRYVGEIFLNIDDGHMNDAEDWIRKAIEADRSHGMMFHLGKDYALYAELLQRRGDKSKAKENLTKAINTLKECGADGWVQRYEAEMASLS
jgi:predicted ATPase/class 3 adenylate cyclase